MVAAWTPHGHRWTARRLPTWRCSKPTGGRGYSTSAGGYTHYGYTHYGYAHYGYAHCGYPHYGYTHYGYTHYGYTHYGYACCGYACCDFACYGYTHCYQLQLFTQ